MSAEVSTRKKILVVEDDDTNQYLMQVIMEELGCDVEVAHDGQEAVERAKHEPFALVFMDVRMPNMNGYEAAQAIRSFNAEVPIIALTAHAMRDVAQRCKEAGMNDVIFKPFDPGKLRALVSNIINAKK